MKFSELSEEYIKYNRVCKEAKRIGRTPEAFYVENKQRINLSHHAYSILLQDMDAFHYRLNLEPGFSEVGSTIINYLFRCYRETAAASIFHSCQKLHTMLANKLENIDEEVRNKVASHLVEKYRKELQAQVNKNLAEKGKTFFVRIDVDNLSFLGKSDHYGMREGEYYKDRIGLYIKAVIEEYAQKPFLDREAIFCSNDIAVINDAIKETRIIKIVTRNKYTHYVKPYAIRTDAEHLYHYLACYASDRIDGSWEAKSFRLSSITECTILHYSGDISHEQKEELEQRIQEKGIQYISDTPQSEMPTKIIVEFTKEGKRLYHEMLHLRPLYVTPPKGFTYQFNCTMRQAENYFFKFGHNVKILEPKELADKFLRRYESAAKQYK